MSNGKPIEHYKQISKQAGLKPIGAAEVDVSLDDADIAAIHKADAALMREMGMSDDEIIDELGYIPEPYERPSPSL